MSTSRVARKPVVIPKGVDVKLTEDQLIVKGSKGQLTLPLHNHVKIDVEDGQVMVGSRSDGAYSPSGSRSKLKRSIAGTTRAKVFNMIVGVTDGFEKRLTLVGVGYRAQSKGNLLGLTLGFSHPVDFVIPNGITIETPSQTEIIVKGIDKHLVGHTAAMIRAIRQPEPYKGKGVRYSDEIIVRKETKKK